MTKPLATQPDITQPEITQPEQPFVLLTQADCPNCVRLERMLAGPLKNAYSDSIRVVHRDLNAEEFAQLTAQHGIQTTPALIHISGAALLNTGGLGEVKAFLQRADG